MRHITFIPVVCLLIYGVFTTVALTGALAKLESALNENMKLSMMLEIAQDENERALEEIARQNAAVKKLQIDMERAQTGYKSKIEELDRQRAEDIASAVLELENDAGAANQLRLIEEHLSQYLISQGGGHD